MKRLDFKPVKSKEEFRRNYKLHDMAEEVGKNLLTQWGINFRNFGSDKRYQKVWEGGEDKPDMLIEFEGKQALLDWKGKRKAKWLVNQRAVRAYEKWSKALNLPVIIAFFVFNDNGELKERRCAILGKNSYRSSPGKQWDANETIEFEEPLPFFNKTEILKAFR